MTCRVPELAPHKNHLTIWTDPRTDSFALGMDPFARCMDLLATWTDPFAISTDLFAISGNFRPLFNGGASGLFLGIDEATHEFMNQSFMYVIH